jgi:hypothetical protein
MTPKRLRGPYRKPVDRASINTFPLQGPRGYRKSIQPCFNGSNRSKGPTARRAPITLAERA